jgi:hypothetical protein
MKTQILAIAIAAGLSAASPATAFSWSSITNYFTRSAPYTPTRIDYRGPMARPPSIGGVAYSAYPAQTENAIANARRTGARIGYRQGSNGTVSGVEINGIVYPGVRLYYRSSTSGTSTSPSWRYDADGGFRVEPTGTPVYDADGSLRYR